MSPFYDEAGNMMISAVSSKTELLNKKLTAALLSDDTDAFRTILEKQGWPRYSEWSDFDLLMQAIKHERKDIVNLLLNLGCRAFKKPNIVTPLHLAATKQGWTDVVERLIGMKLRVADKNNFGRGNGNTALHCAFFDRFSNLDHTIDLLLAAHLRQWADNDNHHQYANIANRDKLSFLHIACTRPNLEIVQTLVDADENSIYSQELQLMRTPLHFAVEYGRHRIAEFLLHYGADVYKQDSNKSTPLHLALKRRDTLMIDLLLAHDKHYKNRINIFGLSHFMASCAGSKVDIVRNYLENVKCPSTVISARVKQLGYLTSYTPLHFAVDYGRVATIELLLKQGANCCAITKLGFTSHHLAKKQGYADACALLSEHCELVKKCKETRAEDSDFREWGEDYEKEILTQRIQMFDYLEKTLTSLSSLLHK